MAPLPGVTNNQRRHHRRLPETGTGRRHAHRRPGTAARQRQGTCCTTWGLGLDPKALQSRIKLRSLPMADSTPEAVSRSKALDTLSNSRYYAYQNPDGTPFGSPKEWADMDKELAANRNRFEFKSSGGQGFFFKNGEPNEKLNEMYRAKQQATANRYRSVENSPNKEEYYRWFGDGANLTDKQWQQYTDGTLDMWHDKPSTREAQNRVQAMRVWAGLTPQERNTYGLPEAGGGNPIAWDASVDTGTERRRTSLANYIAYINAYKNNHYQLGDIDPNPQEALSSAGGSSG
jgi:hypothetical protein